MHGRIWWLQEQAVKAGVSKVTKAAAPQQQAVNTGVSQATKAATSSRLGTLKIIDASLAQ